MLGLLLGCGKQQKIRLALGEWKGEMSLLEDQILPFNFQLNEDENGSLRMIARNATEEVVFDEIEINNDSIMIPMDVFDGFIAAKYSENVIEGLFVDEPRDRQVPFKATFGLQPRFGKTAPSKVDVSGIWEVVFDFDNEDGGYPAKGILSQVGDEVSGTFRTTTGDYRYLEGIVEDEQLKLSTFDGAHAFLFIADVTDSTLNGKFYSGAHSIEKFISKRNEAYELPDANSLTFLKEGYDKFDFSFPDTNGNMVGLSDGNFKDKVVLVQLMGTWCPNCLDETRFYVDYLRRHPNQNLEFVALAFEYAKTEEQAINKLNRFVSRENLDYPLLLAQYGGADKSEANEKLPMLNHVLSYPTTIYIDKKGEVRKIHTGFSGPATGDKYEEFKAEFSNSLEELLAE